MLDPQANAAIAYLRSPGAIRQRCGQIFQLACEDRLHHFACDLTQLGPVADYVIQVTRNQYPDLNIPYHSRWRHFAVGNIPRLAQLEQALAGLTPVERAQSKFDLVITSVLLDAGAGSTWQYFEPETGQVWQRSEGLAVASFHFFCQGGFSSNPHQPYQVDAQRLQALTESDLITGFQVSADNPMVGIPGRLQLLQRLGRLLLAYPQLFDSSSPDVGLRPGNLLHYLLNRAPQGKLAASTVFEAVFDGQQCSSWRGGNGRSPLTPHCEYGGLVQPQVQVLQVIGGSEVTINQTSSRPWTSAGGQVASTAVKDSRIL